MSAKIKLERGGITSWTIKIDGAEIPGDLRIYSISVERNINRISTACITILDGDSAAEDFEVSASRHFVPGGKIVIEAGYDSKNKPVFEGIIVKQTARVDREIGSALEVECKDEAIKMILGRKSALYTELTDSDVISKLINNHSGLSAKVSSTEETIPELVQYYASDWDFMLTRAEVNGMVVSTFDGTVSVFEPDEDREPISRVQYGANMYNFHGELNAVTQLPGVKASSWNFKTQELISGESTQNESGPGNLDGKKLSEVLGLEEFELQTAASTSEKNLKIWANAQMTKSAFSKIRGEVKFQGDAEVKPGKYITIAGMGERFNGDHFVSGIKHDISDGNWFTEATLGLSPDWFTSEAEVSSPIAAGLLPGASGLFNGTVLKIDEDPETEYRIQVDIPLFQGRGEGVWARLGNFYSSEGAGVFFLPEIGDEVILGFLNEDPRFPIILGSLYSSTKKPFEGLEPNAENTKKAIVTKSELRIEFDDENKILTIITPGKNKFELDDKEKEIRLSDENENTLTMSKDGIAAKSPKAISLESDDEVSIQGAKGVTIKASGGDVSVSGTNIEEKADSKYTAKGGTALIDGGGDLTIKGAMVKIN